MTLFTILLSSSLAHADGQLLDAAYAADLCQAWNDTALPAKLGRNGSEWIDSAGSKGSQRMIVSRRDCSNWQKVELNIVADASGNASCTSGGVFSGGDFQWKFEPTTAQWADFTDGFGYFDMPKIMNGFVGPYPTAAANLGNFEIFFAAAGKMALENQVEWNCDGADEDEVGKELAKIDRNDMVKILR